jgi:hypothetical protein
MTDIEDIKRIEHLRKLIDSSEGWKIRSKTRNLEISYYIFMTNYNQLKNSLELFDRKEVSSKIWAIKNRDKLERFQIEVIRLFHNYLASVKSLVDHTNVMIDELYGNNEFLSEYNSKKKEVFINSPLSRFTQDLRNYILHKGIPLMLARKSFDGSNETNSILIDLASLKAWNGWKKEAKAYLDSAKGDINLREIIVAYGSLVIDFYKWFLERQEEIHKEEFGQLGELIKEYNKISRKIFPNQ